MHIFLSEDVLKAHETSLVCKAGMMSQTLEKFNPDEPSSFVSKRALREKARNESMKRVSAKESSLPTSLMEI
jgi:hypothetical protein